MSQNEKILVQKNPPIGVSQTTFQMARLIAWLDVYASSLPAPKTAQEAAGRSQIQELLYEARRTLQSQPDAIAAARSFFDVMGPALFPPSPIVENVFGDERRVVCTVRFDGLAPPDGSLPLFEMKFGLTDATHATAAMVAKVVRNELEAFSAEIVVTYPPPENTMHPDGSIRRSLLS